MSPMNWNVRLNAIFEWWVNTSIGEKVFLEQWDPNLKKCFQTASDLKQMIWICKQLGQSSFLLFKCKEVLNEMIKNTQVYFKSNSKTMHSNLWDKSLRK